MISIQFKAIQSLAFWKPSTDAIATLRPISLWHKPDTNDGNKRHEKLSSDILNIRTQLPFIQNEICWLKANTHSSSSTMGIYLGKASHLCHLLIYPEIRLSQRNFRPVQFTKANCGTQRAFTISKETHRRMTTIVDVDVDDEGQVEDDGQRLVMDMAVASDKYINMKKSKDQRRYKIANND